MRCFVCNLSERTDQLCDKCEIASFEHVEAALLQALRKGSQQLVDERGLVWGVKGDGYVLAKGQGRSRTLDAIEARCFHFKPLLK